MYKNYIKRILDIIFSIILLIILSPILLIVSVLVKMTSKGEIIFKQDRIGKNGKIFKIYKFRSMVQGAENTGTGVYSGKDDFRVTKVGKIIRATSIDELPQLVNILKGEMSFIGPRPVLTYHPYSYEEYTEQQLKRFLVRPGVTGLAQVNGRKQVEWEQRLKYDVQYVKELNFILDLKIFFKTIFKIIFPVDNVNTSITANRKKEEEKVS